MLRISTPRMKAGHRETTVVTSASHESERPMIRLRDPRFQTQFEGEGPRVAGESDRDGAPVLPAVHRCAILTCMDGRVDASKLVGLPGADAYVIRNAGARATEDAIRSLVLSHKLFGTREWFVVQHNHCGMAMLTEDATAELLSSSAKSDAAFGQGRLARFGVPSAREGGHVARIPVRDQEQTLAADVERIRKHPLVPAEVSIFGFLLHVESGRFVQVAQSIDRAATPAPLLSLV